MSEEKSEWFAEWFDTPYYHRLYNHRDEHEAKAFIELVFSSLQLPNGAKVLDMACGKGRHSRVMASLGYEVYGYDLSEKSIAAAHSLHTPHTHFFVHDMREPLPQQNFQACLNLFTSFGYFDLEEENALAIKNVCMALDDQGWFLQDYINAESILCALPWNGTEIRDELVFHIKKELKDRKILKWIDLETPEGNYSFHEQVRVYSEDQLRSLHESAGFTVHKVFGNYQLDPFDAQTSPRLIVLSKKTRTC